MSVSTIKNDSFSYFSSSEPLVKAEEIRNSIFEIIQNLFQKYLGPSLIDPLQIIETKESSMIEEFLRTENSSSNLMEKVCSSVDVMNRLMDLAIDNPAVIMKKNENGETILDVFVKFAFSSSPSSFWQYRTQEILKRLFVAAPWNGDDLVKNLRYIEANDPSLLNRSDWEGVLRELHSSYNLTAEQKNFIVLKMTAYEPSY